MAPDDVVLTALSALFVVTLVDSDMGYGAGSRSSTAFRSVFTVFLRRCQVPPLSGRLFRELQTWLAMVCCGERVAVVTCVDEVFPAQPTVPAGTSSVLSSLDAARERLHACSSPCFAARCRCAALVADVLVALLDGVPPAAIADEACDTVRPACSAAGLFDTPSTISGTPLM